jgi:hypothetical protein
MKTSILELVIYIFRNYPNPLQLSKPRLVKLIYLIDWKHCIDFGGQATNIKWYFNHYGPYVDDVFDIIKEAKDDFEVFSYINPYGGGSSDRIKLISHKFVNLSTTVKATTDIIISKTNELDWSTFISIVYSTFPVKSTSKYSFLNLIEDAKKYKRLQFSHEQ